MVGLTKITNTFWTTLLVASVTSAVWPAFPSNMGVTAGPGSNSARTDHGNSRSDARSNSDSWGDAYPGQKRRLQQAAAHDVSETCTCKNEILALEAKSRALEEEVETLLTEVHSFYPKFNSLKNTIGTSRDGSQVALQSYNIAFSARVGYNKPFLGATEVIVFDEPVVNNGNVYDPYSGKFTSPIAGLYHFEVTILSGFNTTIETMLVMNGNEVARVFSGGFNNRGSGSNSVLLNMEPGDQCWVSVFFGNGDYVHGLWSTFSGYIVHSFNNV